MTVVIHRFEDDLNYSNDLSDEPTWVEFYKRIWPSLISCVRYDRESQWQKWGVDREIKLANGKQFTIDEKKRKKDYGDIALEMWSQYYGHEHPKNKVGWALDRQKRCDFVAYAVVPAQRCYLLPTEILRLAFHRHCRHWLKAANCRMSDAQNNGYVTRNICVPWSVLSQAMTEEMTRDFSSSLSLPTPLKSADQLEFRWQFDQ